jgi:lysine-specific demethylase 8
MKPENISFNQWRLHNLYFVLEHFLGTNFSQKYIQPKRNRLSHDIKENADIKARGKTIPPASIQLNNDFSHINVPTVFKGVAKDWPCMHKWTDDFFATETGDYPVEIIDNIGAAENGSSHINTDMATFINKLKNEQKAYLRVCRLIDDRPELKKDLDLSFIQNLTGGGGKGDIFYLFIGEEGTNTTMHSEMPVTVFIQVRGSKRWSILPPEERIFLDPKAQRLAYYHTKANPLKPDDNNYPILSLAKRYEVITEEGDVLVIPPFYWHYVENISSSVAVAYKHLDIAMAFKQSAMLSTLFFLRTKPTIIESILYNKERNYDVQVVMQGRKAKNKI